MVVMWILHQKLGLTHVGVLFSHKRVLSHLSSVGARFTSWPHALAKCCEPISGAAGQNNVMRPSLACISRVGRGAFQSRQNRLLTAWSACHSWPQSIAPVGRQQRRRSQKPDDNIHGTGQRLCCLRSTDGWEGISKDHSDAVGWTRWDTS